VYCDILVLSIRASVINYWKSCVRRQENSKNICVFFPVLAKNLIEIQKKHIVPCVVFIKIKRIYYSKTFSVLQYNTNALRCRCARFRFALVNNINLSILTNCYRAVRKRFSSLDQILRSNEPAPAPKVGISHWNRQGKNSKYFIIVYICIKKKQQTKE